MEFLVGQGREQILHQCLSQALSRAAGTGTSPGLLPGRGVCPVPSAGIYCDFCQQTSLAEGQLDHPSPGISPWPGGFQHPLGLATSLCPSLNSSFTLGNVYLAEKGSQLGKAKRLFRRTRSGWFSLRQLPVKCPVNDKILTELLRGAISLSFLTLSLLKLFRLQRRGTLFLYFLFSYFFFFFFFSFFYHQLQPQGQL